MFKNPLYIENDDELWLDDSPIHTSDAREKVNVENLIYGLETALLMRPVSYNWKDEKRDINLKNFGFIAQEMQMAAPDIVRTKVNYKDTGEERLGIRPVDLIPILVNAIKELNEKIENMQ